MLVSHGTVWTASQEEVWCILCTEFSYHLDAARKYAPQFFAKIPLASDAVLIQAWKIKQEDIEKSREICTNSNVEPFVVDKDRQPFIPVGNRVA